MTRDCPGEGASWGIHRRLRRRRAVALAATAAGALLVAGATAGCTVSRGARAPARFQGGELSPPLAVPELTLRRADGAPLTRADWQGRLAFVFFGYTRCPDVCPLTLGVVSQSRRLLATSGQQVDAYFVTVDPERDTPARLREYLANFDPPVVGLTGTEAELAAARQAFGVVAERRPLPGSATDYAMDHTALVYLIDGRSGTPRVPLVYPLGFAPEAIAADVGRLAGATRDTTR